MLGERMRAALGQPVLIENVTGAGGSIGVGRVVSAPPDGYTISIGHFGTHVANGAIYPLKYDLLNDLDPVARPPSNPMIFVTRKNFPAANLKELVERIKANPGKTAAGTAGAGSGSHIASLLLQSITGVQLSFVPYRGTGPALQDLIAGQIDLIIDQASNSLPQVRQGTIKAYAVTATERLASAPEVPTVAEAGLPTMLMESGAACGSPTARRARSSTSSTVRWSPRSRSPPCARSLRASASTDRQPGRRRQRRSAPSRRPRPRNGGRSSRRPT